jgi:hypothetical protein
MHKEIFLEDILDHILSNKSDNLSSDIQKLRDLIQYQRAFDNHELANILQQFNVSQQNTTLLTTENLPYPVAYLITGVNEQHNELVKVLFLCDAVECFVRWRMSEMLTVIHAQKQCIPDTVLGRIPQSITRPSMGSWVTAFEHLAKQLNNDSKAQWGVPTKGLNKDISALREITQLRNKLAHGDISGNASTYWTKISQKSMEIFDRYRTLGIKHVATYNGLQYNCTGNQIEPSTATLSHYPTVINTNSNHFGVICNNTTLQIPMTFMLFERSNLEDTSVPFITSSYISSHGKCNTVNSGGSLEYTCIDGQGLKSIKELAEFIELFKLDKDTRSTEPWNGLLDEVDEAIAWDVDRELLKYRWRTDSTVCETPIVLPIPNEANKVTRVEKEACSQSVYAQIPDDVTPTGSLWYFAGKNQSSKSTVLFSWLKNRNSAKGLFVFPHRFTKGELESNLDLFYRSFQEALTLWLRTEMELSDPDTTLVGQYLRDDIKKLLTLFLNIDSQPELIIGLDDIHHLVNKETSNQPLLDILIQDVVVWSQFTKKYVKTNYDRKQKVNTFQGILGKQVFCVATGLDLTVGTTEKFQVDTDEIFNQHPDVSFVYDTTSLADFRDTLGGVQEERWKEITHNFKHPLHSNPPGAHIPSIGHYGAKKLLLDGTIDPQLVQILQKSEGQTITRGQQYIDDLLKLANGNPAIVATVGVNIRSGHISIDDPITPSCYDTISQSEDNPFLQDISRLIPLLIGFLHHFEEPLTITTLEILSGNRLQPTPAHERYILEALFSIPRLVKRVSLNESRSDGNLAFGWVLRSMKSVDTMFEQNGDLFLTQTIVNLRIEYVQNNIDVLSDSLQLKSLLLKQDSSEANTQQNPVQNVFRELRGALNMGIRSCLLEHSSNDILQNSASMLYQTNAIASPQITWLQKSDESHDLQNDATKFIQGPSFNDFWLKHSNAEHIPVFNHQLSSVGYSEKIKCTISINDDFYIVIGNKHNSISIYNINRTQPDIEIFSPSTSGKANDCIVHHCTTTTVGVLYNIKNTVHIHIVELKSQAKELSHHTHDYEADVVQICSLSKTTVGIFGKRKGGKPAKYEFDVLSDLTKKPTHTVFSTGCSKAPKFAFSHKDTNHAIYGDQLITINHQDDDIKVSSICKLAATPKDDPLQTKSDLVTVGGSKNAEMNLTWYSSNHHKALPLMDTHSNSKFAKVVFAENITQNRLLTVGYKGLLRIHEWDNDTPILEVQLTLPENVSSHSRGLNGGLLHNNRLLLYGVKSFMAFFDIEDLLKSLDDDKTYTAAIACHSLNLHYGTIKKASVSGQHFGYKDTFVTISEDNDARLWSFSSGNKKTKGYCLGLFRGHNSKLKEFSLHNDNLLTVDDKQNVYSWKINDGCQNQLKALPQRNPNFIQAIYWYNNRCWVVSREGADLYIENYEDDGTSWTQMTAQQQQTTPLFTSNRGSINIQRVIHIAGFLILVIDKRLYIYDLDTQVFEPYTLDEIPLKIDSVSGFQTGAIVYNDNDIYLINDKKQLHHVHSTPDGQLITAANCTSTEGVVTLIHYAVTIGKPKEKGDLPREVFQLTVNDNSISQLCSVVSTAQISGLQHISGDTLFWIERKENNQPLAYYIHRPSVGTLLKGHSHPLLVAGLKSLYRLPTEDGFAFSSGDNDRKWTVKYDYTYNKDGDPQDKHLQLHLHRNWEYSSLHTAEILETFAEAASVLPESNVFVESIPQGLVLHYQPSNLSEGRRLLWTGDSVKDFKIAQILPNGRILLKKNRSVIVIQLMKGAEPKPFSALTDIED